jgi:glycosyltransferase involved in cell wall biosynthesis
MNRLTATLITCNEEQNLPRALASLEDLADEIVVVDSGSTDGTCEIARQCGARVVHRAFTDYAEQKNFAAAQSSNPWILSLDADEELSPELRGSLRAWKELPPAAAAYEFARRASYLGGWIRHSGWYPDRKVRLYRRDLARFVGRVHESLEVDGPVGRLDGELYHYTVRTFAEHVAKMDTYTTLAAEQLFAAGWRRWRLAMLLAPPWTLLRTYLIQRGFLDGYRGWLIARMAARYVFLKYRKLGRLVENAAGKSAPARGKGAP